MSETVFKAVENHIKGGPKEEGHVFVLGDAIWVEIPGGSRVSLPPRRFMEIVDAIVRPKDEPIRIAR